MRVSDRLFDLRSSDVTGAEAIAARKYGLMHAIYLAAIVVGTIGWLWFIAWIAMRLV